MRRLAIACVVLFAAATTFADITRYGVTTERSRKVDFSAMTTYDWEPAWEPVDLSTHDEIVAAIDRELKARGLTRVSEGAGDISLSYVNMRRADMNMKAKVKGAPGGHAVRDVTVLILRIRDTHTREELFQTRLDTPTALTPDNVRLNVSLLFQDFPRTHRR